ncbi:Isoquinoline 1-oxidoreductase subunit [Myxococcus sp. Y35]|uniref:Isoquinoline 1-oxidoreductase subunit n=1 Tax=Pseudomyxococcus flavus TaxID=3115648 RepID=UPI003CEB3EF3
MASLTVLLLTGGCKREPDAAAARVPSLPEVAPDALRPLEAFSAIPDRKARSQALFLEASRVFFHPRCANCHPAGESPLQGDDGQLHDPPVVRGPEDQGVVGMECTSCHQDRNQELTRVPGAPKWHIAPIEMAWVGKSPREVCEQLKDMKRNGGKTPEQMIEHNAHDELVAWGWNPGSGRTPAPGTQAQFGAIVRAWVETGAECPSEEVRP